MWFKRADYFGEIFETGSSIYIYILISVTLYYFCRKSLMPRFFLQEYFYVQKLSLANFVTGKQADFQHSRKINNTN